MDEQLTIGDIVQLKSGGPEMTISSSPGKYDYDDFDSVKCVWFNGGARVEDLFPAASLRKVPPRRP